LEGEPGESPDDFYARASAAAQTAKAKFIVFGGLPKNPTEWSEPPRQGDCRRDQMPQQR
jgi:hypothetical protein